MAKLLMANPKKRKKSSKTPAKRKSTTVTRRTTKSVTRRKNPARRRIGFMNQAQNAAIGAGGALAVDIVMQRLPFIPANLKVGPMAAITKGIVAVGIGMVVAQFGKNKRLGVQLAEGGMTVAFHDAAKGMIGPTLGLGDYSDLLGMGDYSDLLGNNGTFQPSPGNMNSYETMNSYEQMNGMGDHTNPGMVMEAEDFDL